LKKQRESKSEAPPQTESTKKLPKLSEKKESSKHEEDVQRFYS